MQQLDAPFQTGSASHSPFHPSPAPPSPALRSPALDAPIPAHDLAAPPAMQGARSPAFSSSTSGPAPHAQPYLGAGHGTNASSAIAFGSSAMGYSASSSAVQDAGGMSRASTNGAPRRIDKGKGVARDGGIGQGDEGDEGAEQRRRVERVLQRSESSRLARAFRNRLALASFKTARGWQDVRLDTIEPHLEQETMRRSQGAHSEAMQQHAHPGPAAHFAPHPHEQHVAYAGGAPAHMYPQEHVQSYGMDAVLGGHPPPHKRQRMEDDPNAHAHAHARAQPNLYSAHSVYAQPPNPAQTVSPYSTASVYQRNIFAGGSAFGGPNPALLASASGPPRSPFESQSQDGAVPTPRKQRAAAAASPLGSPRARRAASRRSSPAKPGQPPSSSDPSFSSFVDAATALTGMARVPSDPSQESGSDESGPEARGRTTGAQADQQVRVPFPRPMTPERQVLRLPAQQGDAPGGVGGNGSAGNDSGTADGAAELMLYLAASPSPVQSRKAAPTTLGDGSGVKGRRLFSGVGMGGPPDTPANAGGAPDAASIFGGELNGDAPPPSSSAQALDAPFATSSSSSAAPVEPVKAGIFGAPATPGRQRQPSLGGGASWELFLNTSPSPKRAPSGAGGGAAPGLGTRGASPPHAAIGA